MCQSNCAYFIEIPFGNKAFVIRKDTWFMPEKIFRGFWRYQYLSWILSATHQSHTSIFNGLTLHLSPNSERRIRLALFWKVLILEVKTFQCFRSKPALKAALFTLPWTCCSAGSWMAVSFCWCDQDPLPQVSPSPVLNPALQTVYWLFVQKQVLFGPEVRLPVSNA